MKLWTFVLGGLAGAAAVMIMQNRNMSAVTGGIGQMLRQRANNLKEAAIENGINVKFGGGFFGSNGSAWQGDGSGSSRSRSGLDQAEKIASKDPKVEHQVNEILSENRQHPI